MLSSESDEGVGTIDDDGGAGAYDVEVVAAVIE